MTGQCWWAGFGDTFILMREGQHLRLYHRKDEEWTLGPEVKIVKECTLKSDRHLQPRLGH